MNESQTELPIRKLIQIDLFIFIFFFLEIVPCFFFFSETAVDTKYPLQGFK